MYFESMEISLQIGKGNNSLTKEEIENVNNMHEVRKNKIIEIQINNKLN